MKIRDVSNCARCGGYHKELEAKQLTKPFAPEAATPITWTHWATCPTNGEPIMIVGFDVN